MESFWFFAKRLLRHRRLLWPAMVMAALSASGLGAGLLGALSVLRHIFPTATKSGPVAGETLRAMARRFSESAAGYRLRLPPEWVERLPDTAYTSVVWIMVGLGVLTVLGALANFAHAYLSLTVISRTIADIRREVFRKVIHLPLKTVLGTGTTDLVSRIVYDTATLGAGFNALLSRAVAQVTKGLAALIVAMVVDLRLALIGLLVAPVVAVIIRKLGKRIRRASRSALAAQAGLYQSASEALSGLRVVKVHTAERPESGRFHQINKAVVAQEFRVRTARAVASPLVEVIALFVLGILVVIAAKAIEDQQLNPHDLIAVLTSLGIAGASLKPLTGIVNDIQQSAGAAGRLREVLRLETEPGHGHRLPTIARHKESIEFDNVRLTYPGADSPALRGVSLKIPHGQTVAFVGPNGSGKTTLLSLVPRLFDPDVELSPGEGPSRPGRVLIDGQDIREYSVRSVRRQIAVVTQETVLFKGTIRSNIAYGAGMVDDALIQDAAKRARAEEFILDKPGGYSALLGENGSGLSGGQRQRLAIARAILRDPAILILDEATSMIDADSESKIAEAIAEFVSGRRDEADGSRSTARTCLIVAHRLSTVVHADRIVVMDGGRLVDQGTHRELLGRCPVYRLIARTQLGLGENAPALPAAPIPA